MQKLTVQSIKAQVNALCTTSNGTLWLTRRGAKDGEGINISLSIGFLRILRLEYRGKRLVSLVLDPKQECWSIVSIATITEFLTRKFVDNTTNDYDYAIRDGIFSVSRFHKNIVSNRTVSSTQTNMLVPKLELIYQPKRPLRLFVGAPGLVDLLAWDDDLDVGQELEADIVEVEAKAIG